MLEYVQICKNTELHSHGMVVNRSLTISIFSAHKIATIFVVYQKPQLVFKEFVGFVSPDFMGYVK